MLTLGDGCRNTRIEGVVLQGRVCVCVYVSVSVCVFVCVSVCECLSVCVCAV